MLDMYCKLNIIELASNSFDEMNLMLYKQD